MQVLIDIAIYGENRVQSYDAHRNIVIPAKAGIQRCSTGFRVKPGMTEFLA